MALFETCYSTSDCSREYITISATLEILDIERGVDGRVSAIASDIHLAEWDAETDSLVVDGHMMCIDSWTIDTVF
jgi:hypothetical protein